jgi:radical SAM protein with 4Fe4S-binding SPASM domain
MKAPHRMDLMISSMTKDGHWNCNQQCLHCYAAGQTYSDKKELSTDEWKKAIDKCKKACIPQVTFTGGEPTLRKDLVELVEYSKWFVTRLNTNGVLLTEELCQKLYEASLDSVQVTFYSSNAEEHNKLVGAPNYEKTVQGIKNAINAGLAISINTPLCSINKNYLDTLKFLHELGVKYVTCSGLIITGNATKDASKETQLSEDELYNILKEAKKYTDENLMEISFTSPGWIAEEKLKELGLDIPTCGACLSNMAIAPDGEVVPCQSWLKDGSGLGNILQTPWKKIWNNKECQKIRKYSTKSTGKCPLKEGGC